MTGIIVILFDYLNIYKTFDFSWKLAHLHIQ